MRVCEDCGKKELASKKINDYKGEKRKWGRNRKGAITGKG